MCPLSLLNRVQGKEQKALSVGMEEGITVQYSQRDGLRRESDWGLKAGLRGQRLER